MVKKTLVFLTALVIPASTQGILEVQRTELFWPTSWLLSVQIGLDFHPAGTLSVHFYPIRCRDPIYDNSPTDLRLNTPEPGALIVWRVAGSVRGHIEWIVGVNEDGTVQTIGGNTGPDQGADVIDQGDGVYLKQKVNAKGTAKKPVVGFLRVWE